MGVLSVLFLFIFLRESVATSSEVSSLLSTAHQVPDLIPTTLKYTAQEYHLPSHALYTKTPKTIPSETPSQYIESPVRTYNRVDRNLIQEPLINASPIPVFQENVDRLITPQALKEIRINSTPRLKGLEKPVVSQVINENTLNDNIPYSSEMLAQPSQITPKTKSSPFFHPNQNNEIDLQQFSKKPQRKDIYITENSKDIPTSYNPHDFSYNAPNVANILPQFQTDNNNLGVSANNSERFSGKPDIWKSSQNNHSTLSTGPRAKVKNEPSSKETIDITDTFQEQIDRGNFNTCEYSSKSINYQPTIRYPSTDRMDTDIIQKQQFEEPNKVIKPRYKQPYITTETSNISHNNSPRYKNISSNINSITPETVDLKSETQNKLYNPLIKKQSKNIIEEGKRSFDNSRFKKENADIQNEIERIKQKYNSMSMPVQTMPEKGKVLETELTQKQYSSNNMITKTEDSGDSNDISKMFKESLKNDSKSYIGIKERNSFQNIAYNTPEIKEPTIPKNNLKSVRNISNRQHYLQNSRDSNPIGKNNNRQNDNNYYQITPGPAYELKQNFAEPQYNDDNLIMDSPTGMKNMNHANHIIYTTEEVSNYVPINYDKVALNKQINEILESQNIKQIIDDAIQNSITREIDDKVGLLTPTVSSDYVPRFNEANRTPIVTNIVDPYKDNKNLLDSQIMYAPIYSASPSTSKNNRPYGIQQIPSYYSNFSYYTTPVPVQPTAIIPPALNTVSNSDKIVKIQPQVYSKVPSQTYTYPDNIIINPYHYPSKSESDCLRYSHVYQPRYTSIDTNIYHPYNQATPHTAQTDTSKPLENKGIPYSTVNQANNSPEIENAVPSNDKYSSHVSSSLDNISSIILTKLLSAINSNNTNTNSLAKSIESPSNKNQQTPLELSSFSPSFSLTDSSLDKPSLGIMPSCLQSPMNSLEPSITLNDTISDEKTTASKKTKTKLKPSKNQSISTITINVLPSVRQTSNDIIILV